MNCNQQGELPRRLQGQLALLTAKKPKWTVVNAVEMWHGSTSNESTTTVIATMIDDDNDDDT